MRFLPGHHRRGAYKPLEVRFHERVAKGDPDECWEWQGARVPAGYGSIYSGTRRLSAHRLAWELANGRPVPKGLFVCHRCDNPPCCNPAHLFAATQQINDLDRVLKGRTSRAGAKLTKTQVRSIRDAVANGSRQIDIARAYGLAPTTICDIVKRKTWKDV